MATTPAKEVVKQVKPLLSTNSSEARRRVLQLYKAWYRQIVPIMIEYRLNIPVSQAKEKLRSEFMKNKAVTDIRSIDMLVIKGQMELKEVMCRWKQKNHIMYYFKDTQLPRPNNFLSKFFSGSD